MKLQLIYYYNLYRDDDLEYGETDDESIEYASNAYVDSRLPHERKSFYDALSNRMSKYFANISRLDMKTLVEIPDDVMFQFMIDGLFDYDYISYDMNLHRIGLANIPHVSTRYSTKQNNYATQRGYGGTTKASYESEMMFEFGTSTTSKDEEERNARPNYHSVPDGEHHRNIAEVLRPYVIYRFVEWFKMGAAVIYDTQEVKSRGLSNSGAGYGYDIDEEAPVANYGNTFKSTRVNFLPGEKRSNRVYQMRDDQFIMCMKFWEDDHDIFVEARKYISDNEIEAYKLLRNMVWDQISETK